VGGAARTPSNDSLAAHKEAQLTAFGDRPSGRSLGAS
jgi:hypothetical protein